MYSGGPSAVNRNLSQTPGHEKTHHVGPRRARDRCGVLHNLPSEQQTRNSSSAVQDPFCGDGPCLHVILVLRGAAASPAVIKGFFASCTVNQSVMANVCHGTSAETPESVHHHEITRIVRHFSFHKIHYRSRCAARGYSACISCARTKMQRRCNGEPSQGPPSSAGLLRCCCRTDAVRGQTHIDATNSKYSNPQAPISRSAGDIGARLGARRTGQEETHIPLARALSDQVDEKTSSTTVSLRFLRATANFANSILHALVSPQDGGPCLSITITAFLSAGRLGGRAPLLGVVLRSMTTAKTQSTHSCSFTPDTDHNQLNLMCVRSDHPVLHPEHSQVDRRSSSGLVENSLPVPWMTSSARGQVCVSSGSTSSK